MNKSLLRDIPKVDDLLRSPTLAHLFADAPRVSITEALREELDNIRKNILDGALDALPCTEDILGIRGGARAAEVPPQFKGSYKRHGRCAAYQSWPRLPCKGSRGCR